MLTHHARLFTAVLIGAIYLGGASADASARRRTHHHHHMLHKAEWMGAGAAAGQLAGPAGSAGVGTVHYRHDLKAGGRARRHAIVKIGAPIAAGAVAGPVGTAGYMAYDHRHWIKRHLAPKPRPRRVVVVRGVHKPRG